MVRFDSVSAKLYTISDSRGRRITALPLEEARRGTWDWFQSHGGITDRQAEQVLGTSRHRAEAPASRTDHVPRRLALLVREAWKRATTAKDSWPGC